MSELTEEERERVKDSKHNIQSAAASLSRVDPRKIPKLEEVEECLENADKVLREALQTPASRERSPQDGWPKSIPSPARDSAIYFALRNAFQAWTNS